VRTVCYYLTSCGGRVPRAGGCWKAAAGARCLPLWPLCSSFSLRHSSAFLFNFSCGLPVCVRRWVVIAVRRAIARRRWPGHGSTSLDHWRRRAEVCGTCSARHVGLFVAFWAFVFFLCSVRRALETAKTATGEKRSKGPRATRTPFSPLLDEQLPSRHSSLARLARGCLWSVTLHPAAAAAGTTERGQEQG
jgi:hypothetical protein